MSNTENEIVFLTTREKNFTHERLLEESSPRKIRTCDYEEILNAPAWLRATYIFTDFDRLDAANLEKVALLFRHFRQHDFPVLNNPAMVKTRYALLRALALAGHNDFNAYRWDEGVLPSRYPVFIRREDGHEKPVSGLLQTELELHVAMQNAIALGIPASSLLIVEYAGEPIAAGLFRKLATFKVGGFSVPHLAVHDTDWMVKYGKIGIATEELYREDQHILTTDPYHEAIARAFQLAQIDYGRADFGIVAGRVQTYEINTNPMILSGGEHPSPIRSESQRIFWENYTCALQNLPICPPGEALPWVQLGKKAWRPMPKPEELTRMP